MIKRNGTNLVHLKNGHRAQAQKILDVISSGKYTSESGKIIDIKKEMDLSIRHTLHYKIPVKSKKGDLVAKVSVVEETSTSAAIRLADKNPMLLNFSSAYHPGGGFVSGAKAQEEDLCRSSTLYACLKHQKQFYIDNVEIDDSHYTDGMLYSLNVPFIFHEKWLEQPVFVSVLSAPAPNLSTMPNVDEDYLQEVLDKRILKMLRIAKNRNHKVLILGAWGCGVFGNNPSMMARSFKAGIEKVGNFEEIVFAIVDSSPTQATLKSFQAVF